MKLLLTISIQVGPLKGESWSCEMDDIPDEQLESGGYLLSSLEERHLRPAVYAVMGPLLGAIDKLKPHH